MSNPLIDRFAAERRWAAWRPVDGRKLPVGKGGKAASIADPETWLTLAEAVALVRGMPPDRGGVMLALSAEMRLLCVDFDSSVERNRITNEQAREFVHTAQTYTEVSPSRRGLHVWLELSEAWRPSRCKLAAGEVYADRRFMTLTGWSIEADGEYFAIWGQRPRELRTVGIDEAKRLLALLGYSEPAPAPARPAATVNGGKGKVNQAQLRGLLAFLAAQHPTSENRNAGLFWCANRLREAGVSQEHAEALLVPIVTANGLPRREALRTVASAYGKRRGA